MARLKEKSPATWTPHGADGPLGTLETALAAASGLPSVAVRVRQPMSAGKGNAASIGRTRCVLVQSSAERPEIATTYSRVSEGRPPAPASQSVTRASPAL